MKKTLLIISLFISIFWSCEKDKSIEELQFDTKWWILVHPSYGNSGIYLYNETNSEIEKKLELPNKMKSPHAIEFDGESLWVGGFGDDATLYELNPIDGEILSEIKGIRTGGISSSGDYLYCSENGTVNKIKKNGELIITYYLPTNTIGDIALNDSNLYYVVNGRIDPIIMYNIKTNSTNQILNTEIVSINTLAIKDNNFIVVNDRNEIRRYDINTLEKLSETKTYIDGWITAIAPY